jgi:acyl carrier protein
MTVATVTRDDLVADVKAFLRTMQRPGRSIEIADENEGLVSSGYIDSLAVVQLVSYLEGKHNVDFGAIGLDPDQLSSISSIVELILDSRK